MNLLVPQFPDLWDEVRTDLLHSGLRIWPNKYWLLLAMAAIAATNVELFPGV